MADNSLQSIAKYLEQSLNPQSSKQAEAFLKTIETHPEFAINLLHVVASPNINSSVRLAGALYFKNLVKRKWTNEDGNYLLPIQDVVKIKEEILDVMIQLPPQLQSQIGEAISLIAESDFPQNWENLIDNLVNKLSLEDYAQNKSILVVCHSIFKKWRPLFRSDELFSEIKLVLDKFVGPFLKLFTELDQLIEKNKENSTLLAIYFENLLLLVQIYYDFNSQDIPEFFEDNMQALMTIVLKYLNFNSGLITNANEDDEIDTLIKVKTSIVELVLLYISRYADVFEDLVQPFITSLWSVLNDYVTKQPKYDLLVVKCLQFYSSILKLPKYQNIFNNESSINEIIEKIILPNIYFRELDEEHFEDEPISYIRSDLEGSDFDSRRKSATDFLRDLKEINAELLTNSVMKYVNQFLSDQQNWRNKDIAIYLFSSLATKGSVTNIGVTSTNLLVDVVQFFTDYIANDLINTNNNSHPILIVDSIKYILVFRNQLTKDQLLTTIPLLINHLKNPNPAIFTYAAITIEKLLEMTNFSANFEPVFNKMDIQPYTNELLSNLFTLILLNDRTPEKLAENEFLIKCVMRILMTTEDSLTDRLPIIEQLIKILNITSKNPSNPKFSHYIFESISLLIKFDLGNIAKYVELVIPALLGILGEDVQEFVPYVFQILAFLLESYPKLQGLPESYKALIKPILSPTVWEFRGSVPGITRLLVAILDHDALVFSAIGLTPLLGVFQKLISSKVNDVHGFELLLAILLNVDLQVVQPYLSQIVVLLLTRLKNSRTDKFVKKFVLFITSLAASHLKNEKYLNTGKINANFIADLFNSAQSGVFQQVFNSFVLPTSGTVANLQEKKIVNIGLAQFLQNSIVVVPTAEQLIKNLVAYAGISKVATTGGVGGAPVAASNADFELAASFGSQFSKIVAIQPEQFDPLSHVKNNDFASIKFAILSELEKVPGVLNQLSPEVQESFKLLI